MIDNMLGLCDKKTINDENLLKHMKSLIEHDGDVRPVWIGGGYATTNVTQYSNYATWANQHWGLYYSFINDIDKKVDCVVYDLGCGSGFCTANLGAIFKNSKVTGIDLDKESIDFCNSYNKTESIEYKSEDIIQEPLDNLADYIFLVETLEHIKHQHHFKLIDNLLMSLKVGGKLLISTPNEQTVSSGERGHIGIVTRSHFAKLKERYGKNISLVRYIDNKKLLTGDSVTDDINASHYKIVMERV